MKRKEKVNPIMKLAEGVNLHLIKDKKFKTIRLLVRFREPLSSHTLAKRVIISNLWETSNATYPSNKAFSRRLSEMYGATFSTSVEKKGRQHFLSIHMNIVNPKFLQRETLKDAIEFIHQAIFNPYVTDGAFDVEVFEREQSNLIHYLEAMNEDKPYYAGRQLSQLYFEDKTQALAGVSSVELLQAETPQSVYDYYQEMLKTNAIDVIVSGDVEEQEVSALFQEFDFENRENKAEIFYSQPEVSTVKEKTENKDVAQSILQLAFSHSVPYGSDNYLALQLMNGLLGGFAHSKLFVNVREKASLAYSASSSFDSFTGVFVIAIGIDAKNYDEALSLTMEQVKAMQEGDFTQQELEDTKLMLKSGYLMSKDSQANLVEQAFIKSMLPEAFLEEQEFLSAVENTTKEDIVKVAQGLILQARYFMRGQLNEEE